MANLTYPPFAGNPRIIQAADRDPPIALGDPDRRAVKTLQQALISAGFTLRDGADGVFGPFTQAAVRAAEKKFGLRSDSGRAGPQVIAALDKTLGPTPAPTVPPTLIRVILQQTINSNASRFQKAFTFAENLLNSQNITMSVLQLGIPRMEFADPFFNPYLVLDKTDIRLSSEKQKAGLPNFYRIIFVNCNSLITDNGDTYQEGTTDPSLKPFKPFTTINTFRDPPDEATIIHEMIHATGLEEHDPDPDSVFFKNGSRVKPRTVFKLEHAMAISKSFFAQAKT